jgi:hypothetical protein
LAAIIGQAVGNLFYFAFVSQLIFVHGASYHYPAIPAGFNDVDTNLPMGHKKGNITTDDDQYKTGVHNPDTGIT